jgi:hypothetical protein
MSFEQLTRKVFAWRGFSWKAIQWKPIQWKAIQWKFFQRKAIPWRAIPWFYFLILFILILGGALVLINKSLHGVGVAGMFQEKHKIYFPAAFIGNPPGAQTLHEISNYDDDAKYSVIWEADPLRLASSYILEEAQCTYACDEFANPKVVYRGPNTIWTKKTKSKTGGTFLYRVKGKNDIGTGKSSNIKIVTIVPAPSAAFTTAIAGLTTPKKVSDFLLKKVQFLPHDGCISYWPEEFYKLKQGDAKDYATFASYILGRKGYYPNIVSFVWYGKKGERNEHTVVMYKNSNGTYQYMSNGKILDKVISVPDLLQKEQKRLRASRIGNYLILPPGTKNVCVRE